MRYLVDSDVVIDYLRGYAPTMVKLDELVKSGDEVYLSALTYMEIHAGESADRPETLSKIEAILGTMRQVDVNFQIAGAAGNFKRK